MNIVCKTPLWKWWTLNKTKKRMQMNRKRSAKDKITSTTYSCCYLTTRLRQTLLHMTLNDIRSSVLSSCCFFFSRGVINDRNHSPKKRCKSRNIDKRIKKIRTQNEKAKLYMFMSMITLNIGTVTSNIHDHHTPDIVPSWVQYTNRM